MSPNPYLFVVGCPRSGTTLLQRMLDNHPLLAVANDTHFITEPVADAPIGTDPPLTAELVEWVCTYRRFHRLGLPDAAARAAAERAGTYAEFVSGLYAELAGLRGKPFAGEKTGSYVRDLPRLHGLFPRARFVHIIRDGRDVALSARDWATDGKGPSKLTLWQEDPIAVCALWWRRNVIAGRRDGLALGPQRYREVRYENIVAAPEHRLHDLAEFLDLPDAPQMAAYHVGRTVPATGPSSRKLSSKQRWLPPTAGLRDWRADLTAGEQALFEALAGDLLSELGFERRVHRFTPEVSERAERYRAWWDRHVARHEPAHRLAAVRT